MRRRFAFASIIRYSLRARRRSGAGKVKVDMKGSAFIIASLSLALAGAAAAQHYYCDGKWGSLGSSEGTFRDPSGVAVAPNGNIYVADRYNGRLKYAVRAGGSWQKTALSFAVAGDTGAALALDSSGAPHVAFYDKSAKNVTYAHKKGGDWATSVVAACYDGGGRCGLALGKDGKARVTYYDKAAGGVYYAYEK